MAQLSRGQTLTLISTFMQEVDWARINPDTVRDILADPTGVGRDFTRFIMAGACFPTDPPRPKILFTVTSDDRSKEQLLADLKVLGRGVSAAAGEVINSSAMITSNGVTYRVVGIHGNEFATNENRTAEAVRALAKRRGYITPPAKLALLLREKYTQDQIGARYGIVMHRPIFITDKGTSHYCVLGLYSLSSEDRLTAWNGMPEHEWHSGSLFLFLAPEDEPSDS
jgi:hypothetical protein